MQGDPLLRNPYGVIVINPDRQPDTRFDLAVKFTEYLTSVETQERIGAFGIEEFGQALFHPDSQQWHDAQ